MNHDAPHPARRGSAGAGRPGPAGASTTPSRLPLAQPDILIVDDFPENLSLLSSMLKREGYPVRPATSGKLAIEAALSAPPDLVLLDIKMPDLDGFAVCARFKAEASLKDIPVIFISALSETSDKLAAFEAGGVDYITKPFEEREVRARVRAHLELRQQREQLRENLLRLQALETLRDNLTHMLVHDMRAPLMAMDGHLELLAMFEAKTLSAEGKSYLAQARAGSARLNRMISEMLAVSQLEAGQLKPALKSVDLRELVRKTIREAEGLRADKTIRFVSPSKPLPLAADEELIGRVVENLLANALKYGAEAGKVIVRLIATDQQVRVEVTDDGVGIAAEEQARFFEKFGQVEGNPRRRGAGLGLAFCKLAVEAHGGRIGVISQPGKGSTFWFTLEL